MADDTRWNMTLTDSERAIIEAARRVERHSHCDSDPIECNVEASMGQIEAAIWKLADAELPPEVRCHQAVGLLRTVRLPDAPKEIQF